MGVEFGMRRKQQRAFVVARAHLDSAADGLHDALLSSDLHYATQEAEWQDGPEGTQHVQASHALRDAIQKLRTFELPDARHLE